MKMNWKKKRSATDSGFNSVLKKAFVLTLFTLDPEN